MAGAARLGAACALCLTTLFPLPVAAQSPEQVWPEALDLRVGLTPGRTRLVFDLSEPLARYQLEAKDPHTLLLTLAVSRLEFDPAGVDWAGTPVRGARLLPVDAGLPRQLQFALRQPVTTRTFTLPGEGARGDRLVLDFFTAEEGALPAASAPAAAVAEESAAGPAATPGLRRRAGNDPGGGSRGGPVRRSGGGGSGLDRSSEPPAEAPSAPWTFSGTWEQEWAVSRHGNQKFEALVQPRLDLDLAGVGSLTAVGRLRLDAVGELGPDSSRPWNYSAVNGPWFNSRHAGFELRELYLDTRVGGSFLRLGKQQVVWGQADGIKVLDVVNPQSYREFILDDFDDSRIPLWMANLEVPLGGASDLQLLWIPDTTYHELAEPGTPYELTSPLLVPVAPPGLAVRVDEPDRPDDPWRDSDFGLRLRSNAAGWDFGLHYLYSYSDFPVPVQSLAFEEGSLVGRVQPEYRRNHLAGVTASTVYGGLALRTELAWNSDSWVVGDNIASGGVAESEEFSGVVGLDWQWHSDALLSAQWFHRRLLDHQRSMYREASEDFVSLLWVQSFVNNSWEARALALHSLEDEDTMLQLRLRYWLRSELEIWVGAELFDGDRRGMFGQFDRQDRLLTGFRWGF